MKSECIGVEGLASILDAIKNSDVAITINVNISEIQAEKPAPVNEPIPEPEIPPEHNVPAEFFIVPGETDLYFSHANRALHISSGECTLKTTWKKIKEIAELDDEHIAQYANHKYNGDKSRNVFLRFVDAHKTGRVAPVKVGVATSCQQLTIEHDMFNIQEEPKELPIVKVDKPASNGIDWSSIQGTTIEDMEYKEHNGRIRLRSNSNGNICCTNWDTIVRMSQMPNTRLESEVMTLYPERGHRNLICSLIDAYRQNIIRDPDAFARPMVLIDTFTGYDGGKIEAESAY